MIIVGLTMDLRRTPLHTPVDGHNAYINLFMLTKKYIMTYTLR